MIRRLLSLFAFVAALFVAAEAPADPIYQSQTYACSKVASVTAAAVTQLVPAVTGSNGVAQQIYICGFSLNAGAAAASFQFSYGTGATCAGTPVLIGPLYTLAINGVLVDHNPYYNGMFAAAGNNLCVTPSASGSVTLYYTQF